MQRYGAVTAVCSSTHDSEGRSCRAGSIGHTVYPGEGLASHLLINACRRLVDGQMQRYGAVTAVCSSTHDSEGRGVRAGGIGHTVNPSVAFASSDFDKFSHRLVDGQMQGHDAVATISSTTFNGIGWGCRAGSIGHTINPSVAFTCHLLVNACCRPVDG